MVFSVCYNVIVVRILNLKMTLREKRMIHEMLNQRFDYEEDAMNVDTLGKILHYP